MLEHYGVRVKKELVLDRSNANASFQTGMYTISVPYPFWVKIAKENFDQQNPIVSQLESMVLPWASPLEILKDKTTGLQVAELFKSTKYSWTQNNFFDLSPKEQYSPPPNEMKEQLMGVALSGKFKSFFTGKKIPAREEDKTTATGQTGNKEQDKPETIIAESKDTKLIVVGNARFITENFPAEFDGNRIFFLNAVDWFTIGDYLIGIRSRESTDRPLRVISEEAKAALRFINILGVSILVGLFGLSRFYLRRRRKRLGVSI